ncbi:MAG: prephenate dehydrogenase/arogenate dehydrogenase family protein [Candidatus Bathyarchaeia archaeon]|jgi:prephenate dehydrogenase
MAVATVIGGAGRMGAWFADFLKKKGYRIIISDKNDRQGKNLARQKRFRFIKDSRLAVQPAQLVVLATPTEATKHILLKIEPHLSSSCLLVEISSIKEPVRAILQSMKRRGITVLSIHPMFGPGIKNLTGKTIITTLLPRGRSAAEFLSLFRKEGARIIRSDFDQHDKFASFTLALPHFMNVAFVNVLKTSGLSPNELRAVAGTTFKLQLIIAEMVYRESFGNEISILMDSKNLLETLKAFVRYSNRTLWMLGREKRGDLLQDLRKGQCYLQKDLIFPGVDGRFNAAVEASSAH